MNVLVCVKISDGEISPFDECALECALRIPDGNITVLSMGPLPAKEPLLKLTRLGPVRAILLCDTAFAGADTLATAYTLSMAAKKLSPDLILCGRQSMDGDTAQTGPSLAVLMGVPVITNVLNLNFNNNLVCCNTRMGEETAVLPALLTLERFLNLRFPRIGSKPGAAEVWTAADIDADAAKCGLKGSPTKVVKSSQCNVGHRSCAFVLPEKLDETIQSALKKPRAAMQIKESEKKLETVWCVGDAAVQKARAIAHNVKIIEPDTPYKLADKIRRGAPRAVLWEASLWGRKTAPQVAAMLATGLCADCTALETDGDKLYMIRPAKGGSVIAKIRCDTLPQMATVRCAGAASEKIIAAFGLGAAGHMPELIRWAENRDYEWVTSRPLVDKGFAPYERQIGLTGRAVSPRIYIAIGISGAVQHTCAIENAGTVIAVNPDPQSRIFDYADYGMAISAEDFLREIDKNA